MLDKASKDDGCCIDRLTDEENKKIAALLTAVVTPLCSAMSGTMCPTCVTDAVLETVLYTAVKYGNLQHENALRAVHSAFNSVYEEQGIRMTGSMVEKEQRHEH